MRKGMLLDETGDLDVRDGAVVIGDRLMQDAFLVLDMNQGELKEDPLAGANLTRMIRGKEKTEKMRKTVEVSLERVGIKFEDIEDKLRTTIKN